MLVNMDLPRARLDFLRKDPRVSLTVLDGGDWHRHVRSRGRVVSIEPDEESRTSTGSCRHYRDQDYPARDRPRFSAWIEVDTWHAWNDVRWSSRGMTASRVLSLLSSPPPSGGISVGGR